MEYLWLLPVLLPAVMFFWSNCPCCGEPPSCDYSDDFTVLRDYTCTVSDGSTLSEGLPLAVAVGPLKVGGPWILDSGHVDYADDGEHNVGDGRGWYASTLRANAKLVLDQGCPPECVTDLGVPVSCSWPHWDLRCDAVTARLHCRKVPTLPFPASCCEPTGSVTVGDLGSWSGFDTGHCLKEFTATDVTPTVSASCFLYGDPEYGHDFLSCSQPDGGYGEWGLHLGEPGGGDSNLTPTANTIRVCLSTDWDVGPHVRGDGKATGYLLVWDSSGTLTTVTLGTNHDALTTAAIFAKITLTAVGSLWKVDAEVGGSTTTLNDVAFDFEGSPGSIPTVLPIGMYAIDGGSFSDFCVNGIDTSDICSLCATDEIGDAWEIETTMGVGWDTEDIGGCGSPTSCGVDQWSGTQTLGPWGAGSGTCCWRSCDNAFACWDDGTTVWCVPNGRPIELCTDETPGDEKLVLTYLSYTTADGETFSAITLAVYEAPISDVCGPATFTKVTDNTSGGYFPATVTATRVFTPQGCGGDDEPPGTQDSCCPDEEIPETLSASVTLNSSFDGTLSITSLVHNGNGRWQGTLTITPNTPSGPCGVEELSVTMFCLFTTSESASQVAGWALRITGESDVIATTFTCDPFDASFDFEKGGNCSGILFTIDVTE